MSTRRTLWEEGRHPGRLVVNAAAAVLLVAVLLEVVWHHQLTWVFDIVFVLVCVAAALAVRPRDFFVIGVLPPLLLAGTMLVLSLLDRGTIAGRGDGLVQSLVSGLAHHSGALVVGYVLTLAILALRQVAMRNAGTIRAPQRRRTPARQG